jgi:hypothetical protein
MLEETDRKLSSNTDLLTCYLTAIAGWTAVMSSQLVMSASKYIKY